MKKISKSLFILILGLVLNLALLAVVMIFFYQAKPAPKDIVGVQPLASVPVFENPDLISKIDELIEYGNLPVNNPPNSLGRSNPFAVLKITAEQ